MFKGLWRIVYRVSDVDKAKVWYRQVLDAEPVFDSPMAVVFPVGGSFLALVPGAGASNEGDSVIAYWAVDDAISCYRRLLELGAIPHTDMTGLSGMRWAAVKDPFGNVIGVSSKVDTTEKTVEMKASDTARGVANMRFLATFDEREEIKGPDYLAEIFVAEEIKAAFRDSAKRDWFLTKFFPPGSFRGLIARTAWFDGAVEEALKDRVPQIVFLGAGYDSRLYRFANLIGATRIFEVDAPPPRNTKRVFSTGRVSQFRRASPLSLLTLPGIVWKDALFGAGFDKHQKTLYVWEGVTDDLPAQAIDETLGFIRGSCLPEAPSALTTSARSRGWMRHTE